MGVVRYMSTGYSCSNVDTPTEQSWVGMSTCRWWCCYPNGLKSNQSAHHDFFSTFPFLVQFLFLVEKRHCVGLDSNPETQKGHIYNTNEVIIQTQKYL